MDEAEIKKSKCELQVNYNENASFIEANCKQFLEDPMDSWSENARMVMTEYALEHRSMSLLESIIKSLTYSCMHEYSVHPVFKLVYEKADIEALRILWKSCSCMTTQSYNLVCGATDVGTVREFYKEMWKKCTAHDLHVLQHKMTIAMCTWVQQNKCQMPWILRTPYLELMGGLEVYSACVNMCCGAPTPNIDDVILTSSKTMLTLLIICSVICGYYTNFTKLFSILNSLEMDRDFLKSLLMKCVKLNEMHELMLKTFINCMAKHELTTSVVARCAADDDVIRLVIKHSFLDANDKLLRLLVGLSPILLVHQVDDR